MFVALSKYLAKRTRISVVAVAAILLSACGNAPSLNGNSASDSNTQAKTSWVGVWSTAQYGPYPNGPLQGTAPEPFDSITTPTAFPDNQARNQSFRMVVHPTLGGSMLRLRFSNLVGDRPVILSPVKVALRAVNSSILPNTNTPVLFNGLPSAVIPAGEEVISDPLAFEFAVGDDLSISFMLEGESGPITWHAVSFDTQYVSTPDSGDQTDDVTGLGFTELSLGWFYLSGVDVLREDAAGSIVALGDSITDGAYQVPATNTRWPDLFASRLQAAAIPMGVLNQGINSNRVVAGGPGGASGDPAVLRFDRDVLERSGVRSLVLFEGTNDLTAGATAEEIIAAWISLIDKAHNAGLCVVMGTIMPRDDLIFGWDRATMESSRVVLNEWIMNAASEGLIEGVADFASVMGLPLDLSRPNPALYSPDLLHPTSVGFYVMANAVPIDALVPPPYGNCVNE